VAVSCPAIPCDPGYACNEDYECVPIPGYCDEQTPCGGGYHCDLEENTCVVDTCPEDFQCTGETICLEGSCQECEAGYQPDEDHMKCVRIPSSGCTPFTEPKCLRILQNPDVFAGVSPASLPVLPLKNTEARATVIYGSCLDCAVWRCQRNAADYFTGEILYGGGINVLTARYPEGMCYLLVVKNSPETSLPVAVTITDSHGTVGDAFTTTNPLIEKWYRLPVDFSPTD
jgi:hypothetical protein